MNKVSLFVILFLASYFSYSQEFIEKVDGDETYFEYIATFDSSMTQAKLLNMFQVNLMKTYKGTLIPSDIIDEGEGRIFAKCKSKKLKYDNGIIKDGGFFGYHIHIITKDGKAKIVVNNIDYVGGEMIQMQSGTNFTLEQPDNWVKSPLWNNQSKKEWAKMKNQFRKEINTVLKELIKVDKTISDDF